MQTYHYSTKLIAYRIGFNRKQLQKISSSRRREEFFFYKD